MENILVISEKISLKQVRDLAKATFGDMVKGVIDIDRKILALGGEMHADAEKVLLDSGSKQADLWGINLYPDQAGDDFIEYHSLINIRPSRNNRSMNIEDEDIRKAIKALIDNLII